MGKLTRKTAAFLAALLLLLSLCGTSFAEEAPASRTVRVACGFSNALYLDDAGVLRGYCAHYLRQIAWLKGWTLEYVPVTWAEGLEKMRSGEIDLMCPVQKSAEREEYLDFSEYSGGYEAVGLYARADTKASFNEYEALDKKRVGVENDNMSADDLADFAAEHDLSYTLVSFDTEAELTAALENGSIDMLVSSTMNTLDNTKLVAVLDYFPFYYCTKKGDAALLDELNDGIRYVMINSPDMQISVYEATLKGTAEVGYTKEENAVIANTSEIVYAMYDDCLPLSGHGENGEPIGIYADLLQKIQDYTGIKMTPMLVSTDEFIFDVLSSGRADYIMCSGRLPYVNADTSGFLGSDPIIDYASIAVSKPDYNLDAAKKPVVALTTYRTYLEANILADYPEAEMKYYPSAKECMVAVQSGEADVTYINSWEYNYQSKNPRFQGMVEWENTRVASNVIVVTNAGKNEEWLSIVDKAFHQISSEELDGIIATNVNMPYTSFDAADRWYSLWESTKGFVFVLLALCVILLVYLYMRRQNIRALMEKNKELESANEAKSEFLSRMSHELRTPLNAIAGYAQEQENNCRSNEFNMQTELDSVASIRRAVRYQQSIIGDLLDIRQIESGKIQLNKEAVDATTYMNGVVEMMRPEAEEKKIDFEYNRLTSTSETYVVDPVRLQQILFNLLHNAVKFTPEGGKVRLTAEVTQRKGDDVVLKFVVSDTGIGMSREFLETRLFQNFAQEHGGNTSPYEGCGIGLATCKELVKLMGGEITCESAPGKGSVFTVTIAAKAVPQKLAPAKKPAEDGDITGTHILLCEDNKMNQDIEKRLLERFGCIVDIAADGQIGCDMFEGSAPGAYNMILMDIRMPNMDGLEAARTIRAMPRGDAKTVPIVAVSANAFDEDVQKSLSAGMNEHLAKPMDVYVVKQKILEYCY